jgi:hypothetical protein
VGAVAHRIGDMRSTPQYASLPYTGHPEFSGKVDLTQLGGCRYTVVDPGVTVSSTAGPLLPANFIEVVKVTPGQRVSAISNDAGTFSLAITELTD